uniref:Uncharacterized protein n=1 Tax=Rangifer tarandus platyrhynchus TaxID=3082113 RepID=A0ACB0E6K8_RANTA|nr:unnamed protein product [Rangifer tarandus platyrhynchus]
MEAEKSTIYRKQARDQESQSCAKFQSKFEGSRPRRADGLMDSSPPPPEPLATPAPQTHPCQLSMSLHAPDEQFRLPSTLGQRPENSPQLRPQPLCQVTESRLFYLLRDTTTLTRPEDNICRATSRRTSAP